MSLEAVINNNKPTWFSLTWGSQVPFTWECVFEKLWSLVFYNREIVSGKILYDIFMEWWNKIPLKERLSIRGREMFYSTLVLFLDVGMSEEEFVNDIKKYAPLETFDEYKMYFGIMCRCMTLNEKWSNNLLLLNPQIVEEHKDEFKEKYLYGIASYEHYQVQRENPILPEILPMFDPGNWDTSDREKIIEKQKALKDKAI